MSAIDEETLDRIRGRWSPAERDARSLALLVDMDARRADAEKRAEEAEGRLKAHEEITKTRGERIAEMMNERAAIAGELGCQVDEIRNVLPSLVREAREMSHARDRAQKAEARLAAGCSDAISDESVEERSDAEGRRVDDGWRWHVVGDGAFAPPFGTIRKCRGCGCLVAGGPTACVRCMRAEETATPAAPAIEWSPILVPDPPEAEAESEHIGEQGTTVGSFVADIVFCGGEDEGLTVSFDVPSYRAKEIAEKVYRFVEAELGRKP